MAVTLLYHGVADRVRDERLQVRSESILRHLEWCHDLGFTVVPLAKALGASAERIAAITFDDGLSSIETVLPDLIDRGHHPAVFICPGRVGRENSWASPGRVREPLFDVEAIQFWKRSGVEVGCHGWDHRPFVGRHRDDLRHDLDRCRHWFATVLGGPPRTFAWPFGRYDNAAIETACLFRYAHALGVAPPWGEDVSPWTIPRVTPREGMSRNEFEEAIDLCQFVLDGIDPGSEAAARRAP